MEKNKNIDELVKEVSALSTEADSLYEKAASDEDFDAIESKVAEIKSLETKIEKLKKIESNKRYLKELKAKEAVSADNDEDDDLEEKDSEEDKIEEKEKSMSFNIVKGVLPEDVNVQKGALIQRIIAKDLAKMHGESGAEKMLAQSTSKSYARGLVKSALTTAAPVVGPDVREIIQLLTAECVARKHIRTVSMPNNNMTSPRLRLGNGATWIGETQNYVPTTNEFDTIQFLGKKLSGSTYLTAEFNSFSLPNAVQYVIDDLSNQYSLKEDLTLIMGSAFIQGGDAALAPAYSFYGNAGVRLDCTGNDAISIAKDLGTVEATMRLNFMNPSRGVVFGSPAVFTYIKSIQNTFGAYPFRDEIQSGKLNGFTIAQTPQIPTNLATGSGDTAATNGSPLIFVDTAYTMIADAEKYQLRSTDVGSLVDGGTTQNAFAQDLILYKLANWVDFGTMHDNAVTVLNTVGWSTINSAGSHQLVEAAKTAGSNASAVKARS